MKKKSMIAVVAVVFALCFAIGGTLAWLIDTTSEVKNTFTVGDINIELWEHNYESDTLGSDTVTGNDNYKMIPGDTLPKDPYVIVKANSEACWLFVKVEKSNNFDNFMTCDIADDWTQLTVDAEDNAITDLVYYRNVDATGDNDSNPLYILESNKVTVNEGVTKDKLSALTSEGVELPTLTFTAYAVQSDNVVDKNNNGTAADEAWGIIAQGN